MKVLRIVYILHRHRGLEWLVLLAQGKNQNFENRPLNFGRTLNAFGHY